MKKKLWKNDDKKVEVMSSNAEEGCHTCATTSQRCPLGKGYICWKRRCNVVFRPLVTQRDINVCSGTMRHLWKGEEVLFRESASEQERKIDSHEGRHAQM